MTRWYRRSKHGAYAEVKSFGPFERFEITMRDEQHPILKSAPRRTETWDFFNGDLVKYSTELIYTGGREPRSSSAIYFQNKRPVWNESKSEKCDAQKCKDAFEELRQLMSRSYERLTTEAEFYQNLELRPSNSRPYECKQQWSCG